MTWERRDPLIAAAGHVGGDQQVGDAWDARWVREMGDGTWSVVSRAYFIAESDGVRTMVERTNYLVCTVPGDPGGTEIASSDAYALVPLREPLNDAAVQAAAREAWAPTKAEWNNNMGGWKVPW